MSSCAKRQPDHSYVTTRPEPTGSATREIEASHRARRHGSTTGLTDPATRASSMKQRRYRRVRWSQWFGVHGVDGVRISDGRARARPHDGVRTVPSGMRTARVPSGTEMVRTMIPRTTGLTDPASTASGMKQKRDRRVRWSQWFGVHGVDGVRISNRRARARPHDGARTVQRGMRTTRVPGGTKTVRTMIPRTLRITDPAPVT